MQSDETESSYKPVTILDDGELLSRVIEKHNRFIEAYSSELKSLEEKVNRSRAEYQHICKELDTLETRIVVLKEKRHQLYHQAKKLRIQLLETIVDREQILQLENEIENIENRLQNANIPSDDEYSCIDRITSLLKEMMSAIPDSDDTQQRIMSSIIDILATAREARKELEDIMIAPNEYKNKSNSLKKEFEEMETQMGWLNRRIELHRAALEYWEKEKIGVVHPE